MIANLARKGADSGGRQVYFNIVVFYFLYLTYVSFACFQGWFAKVTLPPKILRFTMVPLLLFLMIVVFNLPKTKSILRNLPLSDLVRLHIFRLIGSFFLILFLLGALPKMIGILAGFGDLITAITSGYVAWAIEQRKSYARTLVYVWNTFGFLDILATSASAFYLTKISMETGAMGVDVLGEFPFCFIPALAPATILFLHIGS